MAFPIQIDATALTGERFLIPGVTGWLDSKSIHTLQLSPGMYGFQTPAGIEASWEFEVTADGKIQYDVAYDVSNHDVPGFLAGHGTSTIRFVGYAITLDATALVIEKFYLLHITDWLNARHLHTVRLLPMGYQFAQLAGVLAEAAFRVTIGGRIDYDADHDVSHPGLPGFLAGRGTAKLTFVGYDIQLDAIALVIEKFSLLYITDWLNARHMHTVRLLPMGYQFVQPNGVVAEAAFRVTIGGRIDYDPSYDVGHSGLPGFLAGRETSTIRFVGYAITLNAMDLAIEKFHLLHTTDWLDARQVHTLQLLPASYRVGQPTGEVFGAAFEVRRDGTLDYAATGDGFLSGRGTSTYTLLGYPITIDASANRGVSLVLRPLGTAIDTTSPTPPTLGLLPQPGLVLELGSTPPKSAGFDLRKDGALVFDEPYPFVEVIGDVRHRTIRLSQNELRTKHPCRCPGAGVRVPVR